MKLKGAILAVMLCVGGCVTDNHQAGPDPSLSNLEADEVELLKSVEATGQRLHEMDNRSRLASDLLLHSININKYPDYYGSVVRPYGGDYRVSFYRRQGNTFRLLADVEFDGQQTPTMVLAPTREPLMEEVSMVLAQQAAVRAGSNQCSAKLRALVVPAADTDKWEVYVLAADDPGSIQVGGHFRALVARGSATVLETRPLSNSCLVLTRADSGEGAAATMPALAMGYSGGSMPTAIHSYLSLQYGLVLNVFTRRGTWSVVDGKLRLLKAAEH